MSRVRFRRKSFAVSIESAIQWFLIHHGITSVTIHNPAVYLLGARVSISPTLVPRLLISIIHRLVWILNRLIPLVLFLHLLILRNQRRAVL